MGVVLGAGAARPRPAGLGAGFVRRVVQGLPELSTSDRLEDRRYVVTGERAWAAGTQDGRFPAMGFHTRGEMGGIWSPPIKLLDGVWFGVDGQWIQPDTKFTSGYGYVKMDLPGRDGLSVERTDFVPDGRRAVLFGLTFEADEGADQSFTSTWTPAPNS